MKTALIFILLAITFEALAYSDEFTQSSPNTTQLLKKTLQPFESQISNLLQSGVVVSASEERIVIAQSYLQGCFDHDLVIKFRHNQDGNNDRYKIVMSCSNVIIQQIDMNAFNAKKKITFSDWLAFRWFQPEDGERFSYRFTNPNIDMQFSKNEFDLHWITSSSEVTYFFLNYIEKTKNTFKERIYETFFMGQGENRLMSESLEIDGIFLQNYYDQHLNQLTEDQFNFLFTDPLFETLKSAFTQ